MLVSFTEGGSWNANYAVLLGRGTARVSGQAEIQSGRLNVESGEVQLLAGEVGRAPAATPMARQRMQEMAMVSRKMADESASEQGIGEAHLGQEREGAPVFPVRHVALLFHDPKQREHRVVGRLGGFQCIDHLAHGRLPPFPEHPHQPQFSVGHRGGFRTRHVSPN